MRIKITMPVMIATRRTATPTRIPMRISKNASLKNIHDCFDLLSPFFSVLFVTTVPLIFFTSVLFNEGIIRVVEMIFVDVIDLMPGETVAFAVESIAIPSEL